MAALLRSFPRGVARLRWRARAFAGSGLDSERNDRSRQGETEAASQHASNFQVFRLRRARTRASLALAELRDLAAERQQLFQSGLRRRREELYAMRDRDTGELVDEARVRFWEANRRFDDSFNAAFYRLVGRASRLSRDLRQKGVQEVMKGSRAHHRLLQLQRQVLWLQRRLGRRPVSNQSETSNASSGSSTDASGTGHAVSKVASHPPLDIWAMLFLGGGVGTGLEGYLGPALVLSSVGLTRACRRFVVLCIDTEDPKRLFRWAPESLRRKQAELFVQLHHELHAMRRIRAGDLNYMMKPGDKAWQQGMNAQYDHTPATLLDLAMTAIAAHPRVNEWVGENVRVEVAPDKVVHRIHEGIAEVFLGWEVKGSVGTAEIQVKATGSIVDFIYIFPKGRDHYGLKPGGFVIRPNGGSWSQDAHELPKELKQPFGKGLHEGRLLRNREGVFDYDYDVREFRHGYEGENHPRAQAYKRWFG